MERGLGTASRVTLRFVALGLVAGQIALIVWLVFFYEPPTEGNADALAPLITVVGSGVVAAVAVFGLLVRESLESQAEHRLNLEAAIEAVQLLTTDDGSEPAESLQIGGALLALLDLNRLGLALSLLDELWPKDLVSPNVASWVISEGLGDPKRGINASAILVENADKAFPEFGGTIYIPEAIYLWSPSMSVPVRQDCATFLAKAANLIALRDPYEGLKEDMLTILLTAYEAGTAEDNAETKSSLAWLVRTMIPAFPMKFGESDTTWTGERGQVYTPHDVQAFADEDHPRVLSNVEKYLDTVAEWADGEPFATYAD